MTPSPYQQAIYDWVADGSGNAIVEAVAGSGKTTTLLEILTRIPAAQSVRFFAFNKQIADTLKARAPRRSNVVISTFHSGGFQALRAKLSPGLSVSKYKWRDLMRTHLGDTDRNAYWSELQTLLDRARGDVVLPDAPLSVWEDLLDRSEIEFDWLIPPGRKSDAEFDRALQAEKDRVLHLTRELLRAGIEAAQERFAWSIDFGDQLYLPILWELPLPRYDWVLVDEAQDTNAVQREFLARSLAHGGRLVAVGDPRQAIYGWRGASHNALDLLQDRWDAQTLPLSVCYRCGTAIVAAAQRIVPQIEAAPYAPEGEVVVDAPREILATLTPEDAILCRNNAPLLETAYALIAEGKAVKVLGRDIGQGLLKLVRRLEPESVEHLEERLDQYRMTEVARYRRLGREDRIGPLTDKVQCLETIIDNLKTPRTLTALEHAIEEMFGERTGGMLTLSTIHKAKGLEWPTVALIREWLLPSKYARTPAQKRQEANLRYVAYTRAARRLIRVDDKPDWLKEKEAKAAEMGATHG